MKNKDIKKMLIIGASGDLGFNLLEKMSNEELMIGAHCFKNSKRPQDFIKKGCKAKIKIFSGDLSSEESAEELISKYIDWAGGIDYLIQLSGAVNNPVNWEEMGQNDWEKDLSVNLTGPFFAAREAIKFMKKNGGKIIFCSTASAAHGGGKTSLAYGAAKAALECVTKGLARECARYNILVNAVAPGFIQTKFHTIQMKRTKQELEERAKLVPLQKAGSPSDVTAVIEYLLSPAGNYITGQVIAIAGGDWL